MLLLFSVNTAYTASAENFSSLKRQVQLLTQENKKLKAQVQSLQSTVNQQKKLEAGIKTATGTLQSIKVDNLNNTKLYVDGRLSKPLDSTGSAATIFNYAGQIYVPLEVLYNTLNSSSKKVTFDRKNSSIYVGTEVSGSQKDITELKSIQGLMDVYSGEKAYFKILDQTIPAFNSLRNYYYRGYSSESDIIYSLNSNYSELNGKFVMPFEQLGSPTEASISFYSVTPSNTATLIDSYTVKQGDEPLPISVPLTGVNLLKIEIKTKGKLATFYDVTLSSLDFD